MVVIKAAAISLPPSHLSPYTAFINSYLRTIGEPRTFVEKGRQLSTNVRSASTSYHPYGCIFLADISRIPDNTLPFIVVKMQTEEVRGLIIGILLPFISVSDV